MQPQGIFTPEFAGSDPIAQPPGPLLPAVGVQLSHGNGAVPLVAIAAYNPGTLDPSLISTGQDNASADGVAPTPATDKLLTLSRLMAYDSDNDTWNRVRAIADGDGQAYALALLALARLQAWNGTDFDRLLTASAANLATLLGVGALLAAPPGQWSAVHAPAANTRASVTLAAGGAGVRHVLTGFSVSITNPAGGTPPGPIGCVVRDGAAGVGAILWHCGTLVAPAGDYRQISLAGLNVVGSPNTDMTIEFLAAPSGGSFQAVSMAGYSAR